MLVLRKSKTTMDFICEFLEYAKDEKIITDLENQCGHPNYPDFKEHRHDQSIFSLLTKKYGLDVYRSPAQNGNKFKQYYKTSNYEQLIVSTRRKGFFL